ncbi:13266_t:CDS:1, partial [Entrophospora sp. SA101]
IKHLKYGFDKEAFYIIAPYLYTTRTRAKVYSGISRIGELK